MVSKLDRLIEDYYSLEYEFNIDKSIEVCEEILKIDPTLVEYRQNLASFYYNKKQYERSIEIYNECIEEGGDRDSSCFMIALSYIRLDEKENAFEYLERIEDEESYLLSRFRIHKILEEYDEAIDYGDRLLELNPKNTMGLHLMSELYSEIDDGERSIFYLRELSDIIPEVKSLELIQLYALERYDELIEIFEDLRQTGHFDRDLEGEYFNCIIGMSYNELNKPYEALKYLINSDRLFERINKKRTIAQIFMEVNDFKCAHRYLKQALEMDELDKDSLFLMCENSYYMEDYLKAIEYSNKLLTNYRCDRAFHLLAAIYFDMGEIERGYESLELTIQTMMAEPESYEGEYIMEIASRLSKAGLSDRALNIYNRLEDKFPDFYYIYLDRARHYKRIGNDELAQRDFKKYNEYKLKEKREFERVFNRHMY